MLVLDRKPGESINIGGNVIVELIRIEGRQIQLGITAPGGYSIVRAELLDREEKSKPADHPAV